MKTSSIFSFVAFAVIAGGVLWFGSGYSSKLSNESIQSQKELAAVWSNKLNQKSWKNLK